MKKNVIYTAFIFISSSVFCFETKTAQSMLLSYIENNNEMKKLVIDAESSQLSLESTKIDNGFDIKLSTGDIVLSFDENDTKFSVKPSVSASIPQYAGLEVSSSASLGISEGEVSAKDISLKLGVDVISSAKLEREVSLKKAERAFLEAKRKLQNQATTLENQFYNKIISLLTDTNALLQAQQSLYDDTISFDSVKARGFSQTSSTYRLAQMKVIADKHDIESKTRALLHEYVVFYRDCGFDIVIEENQDFMELIPSEIPVVQPVNVMDFDKNQYTKIESSNWAYEINSLARQVNKNFFVGVEGGVTFNNSKSNNTTADAGVTSKIGGVDLKAGVSVPISETPYPSVTFGATFTPNASKKQKITEKQNSLNAEKELLEIENAVLDYESFVVQQVQKAEDILWEKASNEESYKMYAQLEKELKDWYEQGFITQSEYLSAKSNAENYKVKLIKNQLEIITYNNDIYSKFIEN